MSAVSGGGLERLSWFSPLGWAQQTAPFTLDRWWPLLYSAGLFAVLVALSLILQSRRDLGAGIVAERPWRAHPGPGLSTPLALAFCLQRTYLMWWSLGVLLMGVVFGSFPAATDERAADMRAEVLQVLGGRPGLAAGSLGDLALYCAMIVSAYASIAAGGLRTEESGNRAEPVLATAVSRAGWLTAWATVALVGSAWLMLLAGLGDGIGGAATMDDWSLLWPTVVGRLAQ